MDGSGRGNITFSQVLGDPFLVVLRKWAPVIEDPPYYGLVARLGSPVEDHRLPGTPVRPRVLEHLEIATPRSRVGGRNTPPGENERGRQCNSKWPFRLRLD